MGVDTVFMPSCTNNIHVLIYGNPFVNGGGRVVSGVVNLIQRLEMFVVVRYPVLF